MTKEATFSAIQDKQRHIKDVARLWRIYSFASWMSKTTDHTGAMDGRVAILFCLLVWPTVVVQLGKFNGSAKLCGNG
jgi:hypothetical protein